MATICEPMIGEIRQEAATTRRVLERVPEDKLSWKPHPKSMSLGQLCLHVAGIPGSIAKLAQVDEFDASQANFEARSPASKEEILATLEESTKAAEEYLSGVSNEAAMSSWRLTANGKEIFAIPRVAMLRSIMLNHWYHHRGQLSVYLRLLDVPVPVIYGRSADENPFA
ncbi:MAG: DinB family protein [Bryobacteraceae bacterium]